MNSLVQVSKYSKVVQFATLLITLFLLTTITVFAQTRTVSGVVVDDAGNPVAGATVQVDEAGGKTTTTDANGNFSVGVSGNASSLTINSLNGLEQVVALAPGSGNIGRISLTAQDESLDEIVVTALGFEVEKSKVGYSTSKVGGANVVNSDQKSVLQGLSAQASGVNIVSSGGDPGTGGYIQIRGQSTITGDLQPLIVVDGVPIVNNTTSIDPVGGVAFNNQRTAGVQEQSRLGDINPNDIKSVQVLKGAAAAAVWGSSAAKGVIVITTKKGSYNGKTKISFRTSNSFDFINKSVPLQTVFGQGLDGIYDESTQGGSWGDKIADRPNGDMNIDESKGYFETADGRRYYQATLGTKANDSLGTVFNPHGGKTSKETYDNGRAMFDFGFTTDNSISISGGNDKTRVFASIGQLYQKGIAKAGSDYKRWTFKINADRKVSKRIKISTGLNYVNSFSNRVQQGSNLNGIYLGGLRTSPDFDMNAYEGTYVAQDGSRIENRQRSYRNPVGASTNSRYDNPLWIMNHIKNTSAVNRLLGRFEITIDIAKGLSLVNRAGIDYSGDAREILFPSIAAADNSGGTYNVSQISQTLFNNDLILRFSKKLSKDFELDGLVGVNYNNDFSTTLLATATNFLIPDVTAPGNLSNALNANVLRYNDIIEVRKIGGYFQLNIALFQRLNIDLGGRLESSSTTKANIFYPSATASYILVKDVGASVLNFAKLRASFGQVGVRPSAYRTSTYYTSYSVSESWGGTLNPSSSVYGGGYSRGYSSGSGNYTLNDPNIKPEIKTEFEFGTDLSFFRDRLTFSLTGYTNETVGAIFAIDRPASSGYNKYYSNVGNLKNWGLEVDLGGVVVRKKDFRFNANLRWSMYRNQLGSREELGGVESIFLAGFTGSSSRAVAGQPLGVLYGGKFARNEDGSYDLDENGFPKADPNNGVIGDPNPDWTASLTLSLRYKNWFFEVLFDHVQGGDVWNGTKGALYYFGTHADLGKESIATKDLKTFDGKIIKAGTTFRGHIGNFGGEDVALTQTWYRSNGGGFGSVSEHFIEDGTRFRFRNVRLGYSFKTPKLFKETFNSIDVSLSARNLFLITGYTGIDPETNLTGPSNGRGLDYFNNPSTQSYTLTVSVNY